MGPRQLEREYLRWGGSRKRAGASIGRFGQGGKESPGPAHGRAGPAHPGPCPSQLESGRLFESEPGTAGEGPDGQLTLAAAERAATEGPTEAPAAADGAADAEPPPPRTPRTAAGSGSGRAIGEIVVRALDPRLRSAMVIEDGVQRVVINSRYPLYEVRKGDLWYQLETALREVCVTIPEATVPEFERKVNELMLVSLSLTERRRRRRRSARQTPMKALDM